jgi:hypothetical protein
VRISTTTLESFRLFMQPDQDWMSEQELIDSINGVFIPTPAVSLGLAFGKVLETPERFQVPGGYACNGFSFDDLTMEAPLALMDRRGVYEAKAVKRYGLCDVVAKADQIVGAHLKEHKTTCSTFNFEKYADSCQWRFMVDIFEPLKVTYHVFLLDDHGNGVVELRGIETFNLYPYANLHQDCCELLGRFVDYVTAKGLDGMLRERQKAAA